jgi:putative ABC transport system permease protein
VTVLKIAFRNMLRNRRRSAMTALAVAVGTMTFLLFGAFVAFVFTSLETDAVRRGGHLTVFKNGYFLLGAGDPAGYGIAHYQDVAQLIRTDPEIAPRLNVISPTLTVAGIAGNFSGENEASKTFFGVGSVPADRATMRRWDEHGIGQRDATDELLSDTNPSLGYVGVGLGRVLRLCEPLKIADCPPEKRSATLTSGLASAVADLPTMEPESAEPESPHIELLAATVGGAPNVVRLDLAGAERQAAKELDDNFVGMNLALAQKLVFGRGEPKVTGIVLQLRRTEDLPLVRARLIGLFAEHGLDLEVRDFTELNPFYAQVHRFFGAMFLFIALIMGVIALFTVVNTMTMTVMERTSEIGTSRALGVRRSGIRLQFMLEGLLLGATGATFGLAVAIVETLGINGAGLRWTPPGNATSTPFRLALLEHPTLFLAGWVAIVAVATLAALAPASRAARLQVVDALRHT